MAEQIYPEASGATKVQRRTVYLRSATDIEIRRDQEAPPERQYVATPVDYPECVGHGFTQEGASMEAERKIRDRIELVARERGGRG
jgi:hypothetical protein